MDNFDRETIRQSILRGADYLILSQNSIGGIKFQDHSEQGSVSGIWVTAETLEFFLTSKVVPLTFYKKIEPMINFLLETQSPEGYWSVLPKKNTNASIEKEPSAIATGHCIYVLKLATLGNDESSEQLKVAIKKGEEWLRRNCIEKDGYAFWEAKPTQRKSNINPNKNESSRMEYIFTTFYAMLGLINPKGYNEDNDRNRLLIKKTINFFNNQAEYFIAKYKSGLKILKAQYTKIASTLCRIVNGLTLLKAVITDEVKKAFKELLSAHSDLFTTSNITVHIEGIQSYAPAYNNNTPFDMANALINIGTNSSDLKRIMDAYVEYQTAEGFWYLNFSSLFVVTTWSTAEALIVLERALDRYSVIEYEEAKYQLELEMKQMQESIITERTREEVQKNELIVKNDKLRHRALFAMIVSIILSIVGILAIAFWTSTPNANPVLKTILSVLIAPLAVNILSSIIMTFNNYDLIKWKKQKNNIKIKEEDKTDGQRFILDE